MSGGFAAFSTARGFGFGFAAFVVGLSGPTGSLGCAPLVAANPSAVKTTIDLLQMFIIDLNVPFHLHGACAVILAFFVG
jgi:hypothetical protein